MQKIATMTSSGAIGVMSPYPTEIIVVTLQ